MKRDGLGITRRATRYLPALAVLAILFLAALPQARGQRAPDSAPVHAAFVYTQCTLPVEQSGSGQSWSAPGLGGATQPVTGQANIAACSLSVLTPYYGSAYMRLVQWDPVSLTPDPTTVALRDFDFGISAPWSSYGRLDLVPPLVTRRHPGVAEPPSRNLAIDLQEVGYYSNTPLTLRDASAGDASLPVALGYASSGPRYVLPGTHPVFAHAVCGGDAMLQDLYLIQCVVTCSTVLDTSALDVVQRFRVPAECQLDWLEVAAAYGAPRPGSDSGVMGILDATGDAGPPASTASPLVASPSGLRQGAVWISHFDFDRLITLEPGHDYWLWVRTNHAQSLYAKSLTGTEGAAFTGAIGPLYTRTDSTQAWSSASGSALAFRVVGVPTGMVGVATPAPAVQLPLRLHTLANPARGTVAFAWSGARGALRFEVLDVRGRRVGAGTAAASAAGHWLWNARRPDGASLGAGVYFVRATDAAGRSATERVVIVR